MPREVRVLFRRADRDHDTVVPAEVVLDLHPARLVGAHQAPNSRPRKPRLRVPAGRGGTGVSPTIAAGTSEVSQTARRPPPTASPAAAHPDRADRRVVGVAREQVREPLLDQHAARTAAPYGRSARRRRLPSPERARPIGPAGMRRSGCAWISAFRSGCASTGVDPGLAQLGERVGERRAASRSRASRRAGSGGCPPSPNRRSSSARKSRQPLDRDLSPGPHVERDPRPLELGPQLGDAVLHDAGSVGQSSRTCGVRGDRRDPVGDRGAGDLEALLERPGTVVDAREDVGVQVDHRATIGTWPCAR